MERGEGRYHYCGLRDIGREAVQGQGVGDIDGNPILPLGLDRQERILLKTSEQLSEEFGALVARIGEMDRSDLFATVCRIRASDPSFLVLGAAPAAAVAAGDRTRAGWGQRGSVR